MDKENEAPSLRESLESAFDADSAASAPDSSTTSAVSSTPAAPSAPAAKTEGALGVAPAVTAKPDAKAPPEATKPADPNAPAVPAAKNVAGAAKMPPGFPDVNVWNSMPENVRAWTKSREAQYGAGLQKNAVAAQFGMQVANELKPYEWMLQAKGVPPAQVVRETMAFNAVMSQGSPQEKRAMFLRAAKHYGVDINGLESADAAPAASLPPEVQQMQQKLDAVLNHFKQGEVQQARHEAQQAWSAVGAMAEDPQYEHLDVVREDMAQLIERGLARTLQEAYQKAMWMRPDTRALLTQQDAAKRAEAARAAAAESTAHGGNAVAGSTKPQTGNLRSIIEQAWDRAA